MHLNIRCELLELITSKKITLSFTGKPADHLNGLLNLKCDVEGCRCNRNLLDVDFD